MSHRIETTPSIGDPDCMDPSWKSLWRLGGVAALLATALFVTDIIVLVAAGEAPSSAQGWFTLLQEARAAGLLQLFFTDLIGVALMAPIALALVAALRRANAAYSALAAVLAIVGIAIVLATNPNYALLHLSERYAAAATAAERSLLLAAGESTMASGFSGTGPILGSFILEGALLILSILMLRGPAFGKGIAYLGIVAHGLDVARSLVFLTVIPILNADVALAIGVPLLAVGGTLQLIWYPWVGLRLLRLAKQAGPE